MAPILSFVLFFLSVVTALPELEARNVNVGPDGLVHAISKRGGVYDPPTGLIRAAELEKRAYGYSNKVDQLEWQLRRNNGLKFCSAYLNYYPATKTQWVTKTKTQRGYYEAVPITRTSTRMVTETSTETVETTATVTDNTMTTTITAEARSETANSPAEPELPSVVRRYNYVPVPRYVGKKYNPSTITSACRRLARPAPTQMITRTSTKTVQAKPTLIRTITVTGTTTTTVQSTTTVSTTTVLGTETSTVPHPCDVPANTHDRVMVAGVSGFEGDSYHDIPDVSARECCLRCWRGDHTGAPKACNGWLHFPMAMDQEGRPDNEHACIISAGPDSPEDARPTDTCPAGTPGFIIQRNQENGHDYNVAGVGPCGYYVEA